MAQLSCAIFFCTNENVIIVFITGYFTCLFPSGESVEVR